jgi:hypothetical protein
MTYNAAYMFPELIITYAAAVLICRLKVDRVMM